MGLISGVTLLNPVQTKKTKAKTFHDLLSFFSIQIKTNTESDSGIPAASFRKPALLRGARLRNVHFITGAVAPVYKRGSATRFFNSSTFFSIRQFYWACPSLKGPVSDRTGCASQLSLPCTSKILSE
jgi:hypothetical protein